jgi:hypothetical protein
VPHDKIVDECIGALHARLSGNAAVDVTSSMSTAK